MDLKRIKVISIIMILFIMLFGTISNADMGPKPSIKIKLTNIDADEYYIDLLTDFKNTGEKTLEEWYTTCSYDNEFLNKENLKDEPIFLYNDNGWMATALRDGLLWGDVKETENNIHHFTYFGVPNVFKIIIQMPDGTLKVSETIERKQFKDRYIVDVETMEVTSGVGIAEKGFLLFSDIFGYAMPVLITVFVELLLAKSFFECTSKNKKVIIFTNIITNVLFQLAFFSILSKYVNIFWTGEFIIVLSEILVYLKLIENVEKKKIVIYTIIANALTGVLTLFSILFFTESIIPMITTFITVFYFEREFRAITD